ITAETRLLMGRGIDTTEQLFSYRDKVSEKITVLKTEKRKQLYKLQRPAAVKSDPEKAAEVKTQITALSKELAVLRKEVVS
ncbi:MAG: relaxase/mobilization nuclease, partial [Oscillospiraceae bacterium]